ncbi:putative Holliday junction resolvase [Waddlia chondrophila 2032/99]|uniref:Putative pre-16S rRNA nuclease n=2 Tax=Waddlia chondrophila TaxID=71667 RepID=D6YWF5_WADCW|nr:Holliday junction resolvase RuvX [Waddlia chondrophila]ADI38466.1 Putative Holliday junction resolvase [Waddlia chondrophila WSU 86-1044]CCB91548.1 putative Holliday junction resolvase [Waddlia chondrophila 2032/99]
MKTRIIGIDYGMKRIGLAISDETHLIASAIETFEASKKMEETVAALVKRLEEHQKEKGYELKEIVVGFPLKMNGKAGFISDEVTLFAETLSKALSIPIIKWDERLTSVQAERAMMEGSYNRKKRTKKLDQISAVIILQNYLDSKNLII